ncbi:hypothetical protein HYW67_01075 [Candidatus Parcubacteria bacterium]|nr:hypothetical protein [Candidatus Parcubacteria bacterium]
MTPEEQTQIKTECHAEWQRWMSKQERFPAGLRHLPLDELNRLLSFAASEELNSIARELNLTPQTRSHMGELTWSYALRHDAAFADTAAIGQRLGVPPETAAHIGDEIKRRIFRVSATPPKPPQPQVSGNLVNLRPDQPSPPSSLAEYNREHR